MRFLFLFGPLTKSYAKSDIHEYFLQIAIKPRILFLHGVLDFTADVSNTFCLTQMTERIILCTNVAIFY